MKIIHSSDWHLGAELHEQSRYLEHVKFLNWLKELLREEKPDALIVSGDIFDCYSPSNLSQELYFSFLGDVVRDKLCRNVVITAGNHDSANLLDSPDKILTQLGITVVGSANINKEAIIIPDKDGNPGLAIGAVPYLRDADIRMSEPGDSDKEISERLRSGFKKHYSDIVAKISELSGEKIPLVLTGHFFMLRAKISDNKSERALTVGNIGEIPFDILPPADYYALGHLHSPQAVANNEFCRYSGSPIPMSFSEAQQEKSLVIVELGKEHRARCIPIPQFQRLEQIRGTPEEIEARINELIASSANVWLGIQVDKYEGNLGEFWDRLPGLVSTTQIKILATEDTRPEKKWTSRIAEDYSLETQTPESVFKMRLNDEGPNLSEDEKAEFFKLFKEILDLVELEKIQGEEKQ